MKHYLIIFLVSMCSAASGTAIAQQDRYVPPRIPQDTAIKAMNLDITAGEINLKININAAGEIQINTEGLKTGPGQAMTPEQSIEALGVIAVFINGGAWDKGDFHMHSDGYLKKVIEYMNNCQDQKHQDQILRKFMDNLKIASVDDMIKLLKQVSWNRDKAANVTEPATPTPPHPMGKL